MSKSYCHLYCWWVWHWGVLIGRALLTYTSHLVEEWIHSCSKYYQIKKQGSIVLGSTIIHINSCSTLCLWLTDHLYNKVYFWWDSKKFYSSYRPDKWCWIQDGVRHFEICNWFFSFFRHTLWYATSGCATYNRIVKKQIFFFYRLCRSTLINDLTDGFNPITR